MTYLPESLISHDIYIYLASVFRYLSYALFTVNPIKLNVIHLHTLLYI